MGAWEKRGRKVLDFLQGTKKPTYWLTRFVFLRVLGFTYFFAFLSLALQAVPLIGSGGILPAENFLNAYGSNFGSSMEAFFSYPTIFWFGISDTALVVFAWLGVTLSLVVLFGYANSIIMFLLWALYMSFVHIGQLWYGYGWEIQLLETGFLAIFIVPLLDWKPFPKRPAPVAIIWLLRWLTFRVHLGSGLIKLRGSECWEKLTCLYYHYETQPIPNPLSPWFHFLPRFVHKLGILFNDLVQLVMPFFVFWPRIARYLAGSLMLLMQFILILNGNYALLNWVTIVPIIAVLDDQFFRKILPRRLVEKADKAERNKKEIKWQQVTAWALLVIVAILSIPVVNNLFFSDRQAMNTSFNQWEFVNTYGAFGSVGKERNELVIEGTSDNIITEQTEWKEYDFKAKPTPVDEPLPIIAPYQPRIDWQIWFAAMSTPQREPWLIHYVWMLLHNDPNALALLEKNPFPDEPPRHIRIQFYQYEFNRPWSDKPVWERTLRGTWLPPVNRQTQGLRQFIQANNWKMDYGN